MIKLLDILENNILVPRRSKEERAKNHQITLQKQVQQYIKGGSKGKLDLYRSPITSLPSNLTVGGDLDLAHSNITSLPSGLSVGGDLDLSGTPITSLPPGLSVGGDLELYGTSITSLPSDLKVRDGLYLGNTPLSKSHKVEQIRQMAPGVKGNIFI